ncbi:MAG: hypothetical protein H7195_03655 [Chryseobacterium sp.]|nr:hypothetical protein [Chryseobacterium sp.]
MIDLIVLVFAGILGSTLTFYLSENLKIGPVRASALLSLLVGLLFYCFPHIFNSYLTKNIPLVFCGTTFIGMVSSKFFGSYFRLAIAGILFVIIYSSKSHFFEGFGGALGALSFISLLTAISISNLCSKKYRLKKVIVRTRKMILHLF